MTKTIDEILGDAISFALLDGQNQIHDLRDGRSTDEETTARMEKSVAYHKDKAKASLLELIKEAEPEVILEDVLTNPSWNEMRKQASDIGYNKGVREYTSNLNKLFNKKEEV